MFDKIIYALTLIVAVYGNGELTILHHPKSLAFKGHNHVKESTLKEVYSAALGFSTEHYSNWEGLYIQDPFNLAKAVVTVAVDGVSDIGLVKGHHFPLRTDTDELNIFTSLEKRVLERYPENNNQLVRIDLSNGFEEIQNYEIFQGVKPSKVKKNSHNFLKNDVEEDREFLKDVALLNALSDKVAQSEKRDDIPDVFWFRISSLHAIVDLYGENSTQFKEAKQVLDESISHLNSAFNKAYKGQALINVISSDAVHTRRARNILQAKAGDNEADKLHLAKNYNKNYPVIFNIMLWFGVAMFFSLLAICIAISTMDPGRDSIIYRMTSTRMKKDN